MSDLKPCPFCGSEPESRISGNHVGAAYVNCHKCGLEMIASSIGSVSRKWNNRPIPWISVEDRLPDFHKQILFYAGDIDGLMKGAFYRHSHRFQNNSGDFFYKSDVTHWMPLPTLPPQEQGE